MSTAKSKQTSRPPVNRYLWGHAEVRESVHPSEYPVANMTELTRVVHPETGEYMKGLDYQKEMEKRKEVNGGAGPENPQPSNEILALGIVAVGLTPVNEPNSHIPREQFNPDRYAYMSD